MVTPYDFRRPSKFNRDHARALQIVGESFARSFSTVLSTTVRTTSQMTFKGVGQLTYDEHVRDIPNPTFLAMVTMEPLPGLSLLHIPLDLVMAIIDRLLGGTGNGPMPSRSLTEIESGLAQNLLLRMFHELAQAFESLVAVQPQLAHQESNPQFTQIAGVNDTVVVLSFDMRVAGHSGIVSLCVPFVQLQPVLEDATGSLARAGRVEVDTGAVHHALQAGVDTAPLMVAVRFNQIELRTSDILDLRPGDILPLSHPVDAPLCLTVGNIPRFQAKPGRRGRRLACIVVDEVKSTKREDQQ